MAVITILKQSIEVYTMITIVKVIKVEDDQHKELTEKGIVICSYKDTDGNLINGISTEHRSKYPNLIEVECIVETI